MTFILGLNLSDKVYLAADSRVTKTSGDTEDHVCKILNLDPKGVKFQLTIAVAGNVRFATFLFNEIKIAVETKTLPVEINKFMQQIKDFVGIKTDEWLSSKKEMSDTKAVLLFAYVDNTVLKEISKTEIEELIHVHKKQYLRDHLSSGDLEKHIAQNEELQKVNAAIIRDTGKSIIEKLEESANPHLPKEMEEAMTEDRNAIYPSTFLFSVTVDAQNGLLEQHTASWGERLAYGDSISIEDVPIELVAMFEISKIKHTTKEHMFEATIVQATIKDTAISSGINSIGGAVILGVVRTEDTQFVFNRNEIVTVNGQLFYKTSNGILIPLVPFCSYSQTSGINALL